MSKNSAVKKPEASEPEEPQPQEAQVEVQPESEVTQPENEVRDTCRTIYTYSACPYS